MRIHYPKEVKEAMEASTPYLMLDTGKKRMVFREGTPQEIKERYEDAGKKIEELRRMAM